MLQVGDRVWWKATESTRLRGTVRELDTNTTVAVLPDGDTDLLYLDAAQLHREDAQ